MTGSNLYQDKNTTTDATEEVKRQNEWQKSENPRGQKGGQTSYPQEQTTEDTTKVGQDITENNEGDMERTSDFPNTEEITQEEE